jgi:hypothetical protein
MSHAIAHDQPLTEASEQCNRVFFGLFLFSLVLVSIPIKNFAYVLPPLFLLAQLLWFDTAAAVRTLLIAASVVMVSCISLFVDSLRGQATNLPGMLLGILTFLPLFMMVAERFDKEIDDATFRKVSRLVAWFVILQTLIGSFQLVVSRNPDAVTGTLGLLDFQLGSVTITQVYFGFLMLSMVLFLLIDPSTWLAKAGIVAGLLVSALSQSGHQSVFFAGALGLFAVLQFRRLDLLLGAATVLAVLAALVLHFYPATIANTRQWYDKTLNGSHSPKRLALEGASTMLQDPKNLLLGTGIGQFSSRAALITSGEQFRYSLPEVFLGQSDYYHQHLQPGLASFDKRGEGSAISKPYFSWLSVIVEFGLVQSLVIAACSVLALLQCVRFMYGSLPEVAWLGTLASAAFVFFLLCCMVENYLEFPQAIFVPYLLFGTGICWARHRTASRRNASGTKQVS